MVKLSEAVPNRVRALRMEREWSLAELAERANTTASQILKLEKSQRRLDFEWVTRLAGAFEISERELIGEEGGGAVVQVPLVGDIAAGNWREAVAHPAEMVFAPASAVNGPNVFALRPRGDSMNLIVSDEGYVLIDPDDTDLRDGKVYAVMNAEGETTLKRYRADPSRLEPCSTNPEHTSITLGREPFTVVGRATSAFHDL